MLLFSWFVNDIKFKQEINQSTAYTLKPITNILRVSRLLGRTKQFSIVGYHTLSYRLEKIR